jgi:hypothetical protein
VGEVLVRAPISRRAEARIGLNSYDIISGAARTVRGFEDITLGTKLALYGVEDGTRSLVPNVSLLLLADLPTGSKALRSSTIQPEAKLALSWELSERFELSSNANLAYPKNDAGRFAEGAGSLSLGIGLTDRLGGYAEYFGFYPQYAGPTHYANTGLTLLLTSDLQLDARVGSTFRSTASERFVGIGIARRW